MRTAEFVEDAFRSYYEQKASSISPPTSVEKREFGFVLWKQGMQRHKGFRSREEMQAYLRACHPSDAYYSCAYYSDTTAEMDRKGWLGSDLVFDIDADHIPTSCGKVHDEWTCCNCQFLGKGPTPEACPVCDGQKFIVKTWPCEKCLDSTRGETLKLLDMLTQDFGFSEREIHVFFSGHRGYHVHVENETVRTLDSVARKEIVDYVCGLGFDTGFRSLNGEATRKSQVPKSPLLGDVSWRGRLTKSLYDFVLNAREEEYARIGVRKSFSDIIRNRDVILRNWNDAGPYRATREVGVETWRRIVESRVETLAARVDTVVTTDVHRLIRLTGALHGKTGLRKVELPSAKVEVFDPFRSAVAFKNGSVTVLVSDAPEFRLGDEVFGPFKNQKVELPTAAAILLVCKNRAEVAE